MDLWKFKENKVFALKNLGFCR